MSVCMHVSVSVNGLKNRKIAIHEKFVVAASALEKIKNFARAIDSQKSAMFHFIFYPQPFGVFYCLAFLSAALNWKTVDNIYL